MDRLSTPDTHTLHRIVAVLVALADLAERATERSAAVRGMILWLLRSGEALARDYVAELMWDAAAQPEALRFTRDSAAEATRLATSFRHPHRPRRRRSCAVPANRHAPICRPCLGLSGRRPRHSGKRHATPRQFISTAWHGPDFLPVQKSRPSATTPRVQNAFPCGTCIFR